MHVQGARTNWRTPSSPARRVGTFEELFEALTWRRSACIKAHRVAQHAALYDPLLALVGHARAEGFIYSEHERLLVANEDPERLLDQLHTFQRPPGMERWLERE